MSLKNKYYIQKISKNTSKELLDKYHYLHEKGDFRSGVNFGLFNKEKGQLIGVCIFHTASAKYLVKGCFGINSYKLEGLYELGRLCINPYNYEKNITSFFLSNSIKLFKKIKQVKALLTYADSDYHTGYIYQACNFKYYGLTSPKKDFFILNEDGTEKKLQRGKCRNLNGEWRDKSQKHRYMIIYDKNLKTIWEELPYPKTQQKALFNYHDSVKENHIIIPIETKQLKLL